MKALGHEYKEFDIRTYSAEVILESLKRFDPELIIYAIDDVVEKKLHVEIRGQHSCPIVMWYCEIRTPETGGGLRGQLGEYIDTLFLSNDGQADYYKEHHGLTVKYLPQAGVPVEKIEYDERWSFQIVFIGTLGVHGFWGKRARFILPLKNMPEFKQLNGATPEERMMYYRLMPKIYGSSSICLDVSHNWEFQKYCSNRYYAIPANGGFSLTKRFPGCEEIYPEGIGKVYFDTYEEEIEKIIYYIDSDHDAEREKIRQLGLEYCRKHHTYPHRIKKMLSYL